MVEWHPAQLSWDLLQQLVGLTLNKVTLTCQTCLPFVHLKVNSTAASILVLQVVVRLVKSTKTVFVNSTNITTNIGTEVLSTLKQLL